MAFEIHIRSYDEELDKEGVEDLEKRCEVGPSEHAFLLFTDTMGDPLCRIRNTPTHMMLVAVLEDIGVIVGAIQGTIKVVTFHTPDDNVAKVGYILGLRVLPLHRRKGIGSTLVRAIEQWFKTKQVDYAYMATEESNQGSVKLFVGKLNYIRFRTPTILVNPIHHHSIPIPPDIQVAKLKVEQAEYLYRKFMSSAEFFPHDIDRVLQNKLNLGTWVAYEDDDILPSSEGRRDGSKGVQVTRLHSWAMLSVWNSSEVFKLRLEKSTIPWLLYAKSTRLLDRVFPCFKVNPMPDFLQPFGFYFVYGVYRDGPCSSRLARALCHFVHNMAKKRNRAADDRCKVIVTEVGGNDALKFHIPHWKLLSCPEDLWCIKPLRDIGGGGGDGGRDQDELLPRATRALFVDPREV